jgi:hypothetical protein
MYLCLNVYRKEINSLITFRKAGVTTTYLRSYVTGSKDAVLSEVG